MILGKLCVNFVVEQSESVWRIVIGIPAWYKSLDYNIQAYFNWREKYGTVLCWLDSLSGRNSNECRWVDVHSIRLKWLEFKIKGNNRSVFLPYHCSRWLDFNGYYHSCDWRTLLEQTCARIYLIISEPRVIGCFSFLRRFF